MFVRIALADNETYSTRSRGYRRRVENRVAAWIRTRSVEDEERDRWLYHFIDAQIVQATIVYVFHCLFRLGVQADLCSASGADIIAAAAAMWPTGLLM